MEAFQRHAEALTGASSGPEVLSELLLLKRVGRALFMAKAEKLQQSKSKCDEIDAHLLTLQNLLYEKEVLERSLKACRDFETSEVARLEMEEGETILEHISSKGPDEDEDAHRRNLQRLQDEQGERQRLFARIEALQEELKAEEERVSSTRQFLDTLPDRLQQIERASLPLQETLGLPLSATRAEHELAQSLPDNLYLLFRQLSALQKAATFRADAATADDDAREWRFKGAQLRLSIDRAAAAADAEPEGRRRGKRRRVAAEEGAVPNEMEQEMDQETSKMDGQRCAVRLQVAMQEPKCAVSLVFVNGAFAPRASVRVEGWEGSGAGLLMNVFAGDVGEESGGGECTFSWVEKLCGMRSLPAARRAFEAGAPDAAQDILARVLLRIRARRRLEEMLGRLERKAFPLPLHPRTHDHHIFPKEERSRYTLAHWQEVQDRPDPFAWSTGEEGGGGTPNGTSAPNGGTSAADPEASPANLVDPADPRDAPGRPGAGPRAPGALRREPWETRGARYFRASVKRDSSAVDVLVEVSSEYPLRPARFLLQSRSVGDAAAFDQDLKAVEVEVNVHYAELLPRVDGADDVADYLLCHQLRRLQVCLDAIMDGKALQADRRGRSRRMALIYRGTKGFEFR